jgi:hypothetical protein
MRARLTTQQYNAFVGVPFEVVVQVQNDEETIKEVHARPGLLPTEAYSSRPLVVSLFPGETADIELEITLPRETPAGLYQLPIEINDENGQVGTLTANVQVAPHDELSVSVAPKVVLGGGSTSFIVTATNRGNRPTGVSVTAGDTDRALKYVIEPKRAQLEGGQALAFRVNAKGKRPLTGNAVPRAIQIDVASRSASLSETVTFTQKPRLSRGLLTAVVLLSIIVLWALVFSAGFRAALAGQQAKKAVAESWAEGSKPDPSISIGAIQARIVAASDGRALPRLILTATPIDSGRPPIAGSSDADGVVLLAGLAPGRYELEVSGAGYVSQKVPFDQRVVPADEPIALPDIEVVGELATISGAVSGGEPAPISTIEARLMIDDSPSDVVINTTSAADGTFEIAGLPSPGRFRLTFTAPGFEPIQLFQEVSAGETLAIPTVKLQAGPGSITGLVVDQSGVPLGGAAITATAGADTVESTTPTTGEDVGVFVLGELRSPATYLVQISLDGYGTQTLTVKVGPGESVVLPNSIVMSRGTGVVRGAVTDSSGTAVGGVSITASNGAIVGQTISVDAGGEYSLAGLPAPGNYVLTFSKEGYQTETVAVRLTATSGASTVNVSLERSLSVITGQVRSSAAAALPGVTIVATSGDLALSTLSTDPNGGFRLENVTSGWWTVTFTLEGYADTVVLVQVTNADQNLGTVTMRPPST